MTNMYPNNHTWLTSWPRSYTAVFYTWESAAAFAYSLGQAGLPARVAKEEEAWQVTWTQECPQQYLYNSNPYQAVWTSSS